MLFFVFFTFKISFIQKNKNCPDNLNCYTTYRSISILPNLSKIYERGLYTQLNKCFDPTLSKYQFGFGKGYNAQQYLLAMLEKWRASLDQTAN